MRETQTNEEELQKCTSFQNQNLMFNMQQQHKAQKRGYYQDKMSYINEGYGLSASTSSRLSSHNSFLKHTGYLRDNLRASGTITFELPLNFNQVDIYIITSTTAVKQGFPVVFSESPPRRDLRHVGLTESEEKKGLTMSR